MELNSMPFCQKNLHMVCLDMHLESYSYEKGRLLDPNRWIYSTVKEATTDEECTLPFAMSKGGAKF